MRELAELIGGTDWIDTHEHLVEERGRLGEGPCVFHDALGGEHVLPGGWTALIAHYAIDDLVSAGLPPGVARELIAGDPDPLAAWEALVPWFDATRATGYLRAVDLSTEALFGLRLARDTCEEIDARCRALRVPGYYARVLRGVAGVERCQIHSLERDPFCETAHPDLLDQDLSVYPLITGRHEAAERLAGIEVGTLADYVDVVEAVFARFGPRAVAVKSLAAYFRPIAMTAPDAPPSRAFARLRRGDDDRDDRRRVEDFLFARCVELATAHGLPVKLHLGTLAGNRQPQLRSVAGHVDAAIGLLQAHPRTTFVLMHTAWPHQERLLAVAKHHPNAVVDLCWAWSLAPRSTQRFVEAFLTTVPATKLLGFGGDSMTVETVVGHAELARRGLRAALEALVTDAWLTGDQALAIAPLVMRGNADRVFEGRQGAGAG